MIYRLSRRAFLTATATAGAALAMPAIITRAQESNVINMVGNDAFVPKAIRDAFTAETGIQVNFRSTTDASQLFNLVAAEGNQRQTDLAILAGHRLYGFIAADYLQPIDEAQLPGMSALNPVYRDAPAQFINGDRYGVPVLTGFALIASRQGAVDPADAASWETIFGDKYTGRVTNRPGSALYAAMFHLGLQDAWFNYDGDPAPVEAMFKECRDYVVSRKQVLRKWYEASAELQQLFIGQEVDAGVGLTEAVMPLVSADPSIVANVPEQGSWGWTHNYVLFKNSQNQAGTYRFIEFLLTQPQIGGAMTASTGSISTFLDATGGLTQEQIRAVSYSEEQLKRVGFLDVKGTDDNRYALLDQYGAGLREA